MTRHQLRCEHWDDARGWCPVTFRGEESRILQAAEQHASAIHHRRPGARLRRELRSRLR